MSDEVFQGLPVLCCFPGSLAQRAGVRPGDVVLIANGVRIDSVDAYAAARRRDDTQVALTVQRGNRILDFVLRFDAPELPAAGADPSVDGSSEPPTVLA
ncbi:MAG: PDZ domain-containing protein [Myxococcales bacterium]|nr:PDZ domain-containing protein [Myxococcales bacterium]